MISWRVVTERERNHADPLTLSCRVSGREIGALIDRVFQLDQMADSIADREKLSFSFRASRGPLTLSMAGMEWSPELISCYDEAEFGATERTQWEEMEEEGESL